MSLPKHGVSQLSNKEIIKFYKDYPKMFIHLTPERRQELMHTWDFLEKYISKEGSIDYTFLHSIVEKDPTLVETIPPEHILYLLIRYPMHIPKKILHDLFTKHPEFSTYIPLHKEFMTILSHCPLISHFVKLTKKQLIQLYENDNSIIEQLPIEKLAVLCKYDISIIPRLTKQTAHALLRYDRDLFSHMFNNFIDADLLHELGYKDRFTIEEMQDDTSVVTIVAACHGIPYGIRKLPVSLTRVTNAPWNLCAISNTNRKIKLYHDICSIQNPNKMTEEPEITHISKGDGDEWEKRKEYMKHRDAPDIHYFQKGDEMIYKKFSEINEDGTISNFRFLLIKGDTRCFNLFSIKDDWNMEEILAMFQGKHVIFFDYSCSLLPKSLASLPPEKLKTLGGTRKSRASRTRTSRASRASRPRFT